MSTSPRSADLLIDALGWLRSDATLTDRLGTDGDVMAYSQVDSASVPVTVGVTTVTGSSTRRNLREQKTIILEVEAAATNEWIDANGTLALHRILDAVSDRLTQHADGWRALGESGGTDSPIPDSDRNRWAGVRRYDFERID